MRLPVTPTFLLIVHGLIAVGLGCGLFASRDTRAANEPLRSQIVQFQELSESSPENAIKDLEALQNSPSANSTDSDRVELLIALIPLYIDVGNKEQAKTAIASLAKLGEKHGELPGNRLASGTGADFQAGLLSDQGQLAEALSLIEKTLATFDKIEDPRLVYQTHSLAGDVYSKLGNFQVALQHQLTALDALGNETDWHSQLNRAKSLNNIGKLYLRLKNPKTALDYNARAEALAEKIGAGGLLANIANYRGYAYADQDRWEPAVAAYTNALGIARKVGNIRDEIISLNNLADAAMNQSHFADCVTFAEQAVEVAHNNKNTEYEAVALGNMGICRLNLGAINQGKNDIGRGLDFLRKNKALPQLELMLGDLSNAYKKAGMFKDALLAKEEQTQLATELFHAERDRAVMELQVRFDINQRQKEIDALEQKNRLQDVEIQNKNLQRIVAILAILVAIAAAATLFALNRRVSRSNQRLRKSNQQLVHKSTHDPLTGLLNRRAFEEIMKQQYRNPQLAGAPDSQLHSVLILLDIDHFKVVNDQHGHATGDQVLVELGERLQSILREHDRLIRWGGEEFMIYVHKIPQERIAHAIERALGVVAATPFMHSGRKIWVTISIGYIQMPLPGEPGSEISWDKALQLCDEAMYMAKDGGRNQAIGVEFNQNQGQPASSIGERGLRNAIDDGIVLMRQLGGPTKENNY